MPNGFLGPKPSYHAPKRTACRSGIAPFRTHDCMDYDGAARKIGCGCTDHVKRTMSTSDDLRCSELNHWPKKISSTVPSLVDAQHPPRCRPGCELEQVSWSVSVIMMSILVALLERGDNHVCRGCRCAGRSFTGQNSGPASRIPNFVSSTAFRWLTHAWLIYRRQMLLQICASAEEGE